MENKELKVIADAMLDYELTNSRLCDLPDILASITLDDIKKRLDNLTWGYYNMCIFIQGWRRITGLSANIERYG